MRKNTIFFIFLSLFVIGNSVFASDGSPCPPPEFGVAGGGSSVAGRNCGKTSTDHPMYAKDKSLRAFPTAEGFGAGTVGGRGGTVRYVDNLNDSGAGSFRAAVTASGRRTVLFRVGGTIELTSPIIITEPYLTIDGRTAPGDGVTLRRRTGSFDAPPVRIATSEVIVRYMRFRPGPTNISSACCGDAFSIASPDTKIRNVIVDHSSFSWGEDETVDIWYDSSDISIQWSVISEPLNQVLSGGNRAVHTERVGKATLFGSTAENFRMSFHHNLIAFSPSRNARFAGAKANKNGLVEFNNNYVYGWTSFGLEIGRYSYGNYNLVPANFINNYFEAIATTSYQRCPAAIDEGMAQKPVIYVAGNYNQTNANINKTLMNPDTQDPWMLMCVNGGTPYMQNTASKVYQRTSPNPPSEYNLKLHSGKELRELILAEVGATLPRRDPVDARIINQVRAKSGGIINDPSAVGGYPVLRSGQALQDTDGDGLPDEFEAKYGLDHKDVTDGAKDADGDGYTNLEEYLNNLQ